MALRITQQFVEVLGRSTAPIDVSASSSLTLLVSASSGIFNVAATSEIEVETEAFVGFNRPVSAASSFTPTATGHSGIYEVAGANALVTYVPTIDPVTFEPILLEFGLVGEASSGASHLEPAASTLALTHVATASFSGPESVIVFTQTASVEHSNARAKSTLNLSVAASVSIRRNVSAQSTLAITQSVAYVLADPDLCLYAPYIGSGDGPTPPPQTLPAASELTGFRLIYPATGTATDTLVLRAPNLGNIDRFSMDRINLETRGGTLIVFADPIWPKVQTLLLTFSVLKQDEAYGLLTFMRTHIGEEIRLIDWEDRAWRGVIINPQDPIVEDRRNSYTASFEFEGERES